MNLIEAFVGGLLVAYLQTQLQLNWTVWMWYGVAVFLDACSNVARNKERELVRKIAATSRDLLALLLNQVKGTGPR